MFKKLKEINLLPKPFEFYTAADLWADEHTSKQMLKYHLNESVDISSRKKSFIDRSAAWISSEFGVGSQTEIADFGCGPGLYIFNFAQQGARVTGIDFSKNSIDYAKQKAAANGLNINYVLANYLDFETTSKFDLITMIFCDYCALSPAQRRRMLAKFKSFLKPNGYLLLDVYSLKCFDTVEESAGYELNLLDGFWSENEYYAFVNTFRYEQEKVMLEKYTIVEESRKRVVYNWLQFFSEESLKQEFEENGFKIEALYADVAGAKLGSDSTEIAIVAKKRG